MDPFDEVATDVDTGLSEIVNDLVYLETSPPSSQMEIKEQILQTLEDAGEDLDELKRALDAMKQDPSKFPLLNSDIIRDRERMIKSMEERYKNVKNRAAHFRIKVQNTPQAAKPQVSSKYAKYEQDQDEEHQNYVDQYEDQVVEVLEKEEIVLTEINDQVTTINEVAKMIKDELDVHDDIITNIETKTLTLNDRLLNASDKIDQVIKISKKSKYCLIIMLMMVNVYLIYKIMLG
ncbi:hypothetical protein PCE1_003590 [Barthelona sp. PCE]